MQARRKAAAETLPAHRIVTRDDAIAEMSAALVRLCGRGAACGTLAGAEFCCGFQMWDREDFRRRSAAVLGGEPMTQARSERAANLCWQLHGTSRGWDVYSNDTLARLAFELLGRRIAVV